MKNKKLTLEEIIKNEDGTFKFKYNDGSFGIMTKENMEKTNRIGVENGT